MACGDYDAVLLVSFGGPERREDVMPFLENVVRGRGVPRERLLHVAENYYAIGGASPINRQNRALIASLRERLATEGPDLPVYFGNRNWHPMLPDTIRTMADDGVRRALAFVTSAFGSYSGCRQYSENIEAARAVVGQGAPEVDKIRLYFNHPGFIDAMADRVADALADPKLRNEQDVTLVYTAHSIPITMADTSPYLAQLRESARLVSACVGHDSWKLAFQSRSGPPSQPWLEPDISDLLVTLSEEGVKQVCVVPIGFVSDHVEVINDLDTDAASRARSVGLGFVRAQTVGIHPRFVSGVYDLIAERMNGSSDRQAVGSMPPCADICRVDCCPRPMRPGRGTQHGASRS